MTNEQYINLVDRNIKLKAHNVGITGKHWGSKPTARVARATRRFETSSRRG